jgi:hypothetical protein
VGDGDEERGTESPGAAATRRGRRGTGSERRQRNGGAGERGALAGRRRGNGVGSGITTARFLGTHDRVVGGPGEKPVNKPDEMQCGEVGWNG